MKTKVGLACAGGVVEGALYELGALTALEDHIEPLDFTKIEVFVGVSSGALITSLLANGISPRVMCDAVMSRSDPSLTLRPEVLFTPALQEYVHRLTKIPGTVLETWKRFLLKPTDLSLFGILSSLGSLLPAGVFDNAPLQRYLANVFAQENRTDDFRKLGAQLRIVAINLDTAEKVVFGEPSTQDVPISRAVQASTALPGLYVPVDINGARYIDGIARRTVHASTALEQEVDLLFCINPIVPITFAPEHAAEAASIADHGFPFVLSQTFRMLVYSRMLTGFSKYSHLYPNADIILIEPELDDYRLFFSNIFSFSNRKSVSEYAYNSTRRYLLENEAALSKKLSRHGMHLRMEALRDPDRTLYPAGGSAAGSNRSPHGMLRDVHSTLDDLDHTLQRIEASLRWESERAQAERFVQSGDPLLN